MEYAELSTTPQSLRTMKHLREAKSYVFTKFGGGETYKFEYSETNQTALKNIDPGHIGWRAQNQQQKPLSVCVHFGSRPGISRPAAIVYSDSSSAIMLSGSRLYWAAPGQTADEFRAELLSLLGGTIE